VNWPTSRVLSLPIALSFTLTHAVGKGTVYFPPDVTAPFSLAAREMPSDTAFSVSVRLGRHGHNITYLPLVHALAVSLVEAVVRLLVVFPSAFYMFLPIPGKWIDPGLYLVLPGTQPTPPSLLSSLPSDPKKLKIKKGREIPLPDESRRTLEYMKKTCVALILKRIINERNNNDINFLYTSDCVVHADQVQPLRGHDDVLSFFERLHRFYPGLRMYIEDLGTDDRYGTARLSFCRWRATYQPRPATSSTSPSSSAAAAVPVSSPVSTASSTSSSSSSSSSPSASTERPEDRPLPQLTGYVWSVMFGSKVTEQRWYFPPSIRLGW